MRAAVIINFDIEGFHHYPGAPESVGFLSDRHRHTFKISAGFGVTDLNREKEIFLERDKVKRFLFKKYNNPCEFGAMSCEMIAKELLLKFKSVGMVWCQVMEEETGGAIVEL